MRIALSLWLVGVTCAGGCISEEDASLDSDGALEPEEDLEYDTYALVGPSLPNVAAGQYHSCAVAGDGTVQCWGNGSSGRLGNGATLHQSTPVDVIGIDDAVAVSAGRQHTCALRAGGAVACWGNNAYGQLGDGTKTSRTTPVAVSGLSGAVAVSAGAYHTCAVTASGRVQCWGYNAFGELGNGSTATATTPRTVGAEVKLMGFSFFVPEQNVVDVDAGAWSTCARNTSGVVRCWGRNNAGQLGDGTTTQRNSPVSVASIDDAVDISAGDRHACAVLGTTKMKCWGANNYGQLGDMSTTNRLTPVPAIVIEVFSTKIALSGVQRVSAGDMHTCAITSDDTQWCAGRNNYGQHGRDGTSDTILIAPTPVKAVQTAAGGYHTCARTLSGAVTCFGRDNYGQLGGMDECPADASLVLESVEPAAGERFSKGGIHYVTGNGVDLTLRASACADIDHVSLNGLNLGTAPDPDGGSRYYQILSQTDLGDGTVRMIVRVHYYGGGTGASAPIEVAVQGIGGDVVAAQTTVASVHAIGGNGGLIHLSQNEIRNEVIAAMYDKFGDGNVYHRTKYPDLYDFDYEGLTVYLTSWGIYFRGSAKAAVLGDIPTCDPTVTVDGTFQIVEDGIGITTQWVDGPSVDTDFPLLCDVLTLELSQLVAEIIDWTTDDNIQRRVDKRIRKLGEICEEPLGCNNVVQAIVHTAGAVELQIKPLIDTIAIRNVYDTDELKDYDGFGDPMVRGMAIPAGQWLSFSTSEMVETCSIPTPDCTSETRLVSGTGTFNRDVNPPVPTPWPDCSSPPCPYYEGRHGPWLAMRGARRDPDLLPLPDHNVATLVGRTFSRVSGALVQGTPFDAGDYLCVMPPVDGEANRLVLGRNDINAPTGGWVGEYGTGEAIVTIGFPSDGLAGFLDECEQ